MDKITVKLKSAAAILFILLLIAPFAIEASLPEPTRFKSEEAYKTFNVWYTEKGKATELNAFKSDRRVTLSAVFKKRENKGTCLIIHTKNLEILAFTKNKILYKGIGEGYTLIPVDEVLKGQEMTLVLTPVKDKTGRIDKTVRLQTKNEFLLSLIINSKPALIFTFLFIAAAVIFLAKKNYGLCLCFIFLAVFTLTACGLYQFFFGCGRLRTAAMAVSLAGSVYFAAEFSIRHIIIALKGRM